MRLGTIFSTAWEITRKQRPLWVFGFLASLLGFPVLVDAFHVPPLNEAYLHTMSHTTITPGWRPQSFWGQVMAIMPERTAMAVNAAEVAIFFATIALFVTFFALGEGALLNGTVRALNGETLNAGDLWAAARRFFWRIFFFPWPVGFVFSMIVIGSGLLIAFAAVQYSGWIALIGVPLLPVFFVTAWLITIYIHLGNGAIAIEDLSLWKAMRRAWEVWKPHFWLVMLTAFALDVTMWLVSTALSYAALIGVLALSLALQMGGTTLVVWFVNHPAILVLASLLLILGGRAILAIFLAPVVTFTTVGWGLLYSWLSGNWPLPPVASPSEAMPAPQNTA